MAHEPARMPPVLGPDSPPRHALAELASRYAREVRGATAHVVVRGLTLATTEVRPGQLFVALRGENHHGADFSGQAAAQGAVAILTDAAGADEAEATGLPVLVVDDPRSLLGELSSRIYRTRPGDGLPLLLGTTGTNGKTSVTHLVAAILRQLGVTSGLSSTAERHVGDEVVVSRLTTPEAPEFHALLALMRERAVAAVAVEVSAQALSRGRMDGVRFDVAAFTNLSHDHLDDYGDMDAYLEAKLRLFRADRSRRAVVSLDSAAGRTVAARAEVPVVTIRTPLLAPDQDAADWTVDVRDERQDGTEFRLVGPGRRALTTTVPVIGRHMAANAGMAIVMLLEAGVAWDALVGALDGRRIAASIPGRTERVSGARGPAVYVDFGHSADAFEKTLAAVRRVTPGRVLMLFGADGDRDPTKREEMARAAVRGSDILVVTDHHPRFEDPGAIRAALVAGARASRPDGVIHEIAPPERAIVAAVGMVGEGDAILWAGPGHQDYREIRGIRTPYSARELARRALRDAGWPAA